MTCLRVNVKCAGCDHFAQQHKHIKTHLRITDTLHSTLNSNDCLCEHAGWSEISLSPSASDTACLTRSLYIVSGNNTSSSGSSQTRTCLQTCALCADSYHPCAKSKVSSGPLFSMRSLIWAFVVRACPEGTFLHDGAPVIINHFIIQLYHVFPVRKQTYVILTPLNPTFIKSNWGLQGYTLFFLFLLKNINCGYSLEPPRQGGSNEYPQSMFWAEIWKDIRIFIWKISVFGGKIFCILE